LFFIGQEGIVEIPLDPCVIRIGGSKVSQLHGEGDEAPVHVFDGLSFIHHETIGDGVDLIELGVLNACISNEESIKLVSSILGGLACADVSLVLGSNRQVYHVESGGIELIVYHLPPCEIVRVIRLETLLDNEP
jgi:hypothetical protein